MMIWRGLGNDGAMFEPLLKSVEPKVLENLLEREVEPQSFVNCFHQYVWDFTNYWP